jgi:cell division protein FtsB
MEETKSPISGIWLLIALIFGVLIFGDLTRRMTDARRMERDGRMLATEVTHLEAANSELETQIAQANDEANVARWARAEAKLVLEGERLVVPLPAERLTEEQAPALDLAQDAPTTWEIWWALLVGGYR